MNRRMGFTVTLSPAFVQSFAASKYSPTGVCGPHGPSNRSIKKINHSAGARIPPLSEGHRPSNYEFLNFVHQQKLAAEKERGLKHVHTPASVMSLRCGCYYSRLLLHRFNPGLGFIKLHTSRYKFLITELQ